MGDNSDDAAKVAKRTAELLRTQGWCLWRCSVLGGEVITLTRDDFSPSEEEERRIMKALASIADKEGNKINHDWLGTPYTVSELQHLLEEDEATIRLVHEAKKQGATVE